MPNPFVLRKGFFLLTVTSAHRFLVWGRNNRYVAERIWDHLSANLCNL